MDGELKDVVDAIVEKTGLVAAFRAEGSMEAEGRMENIQEFLGVAAEFEESHEDIEGTLESLEELRAAGVADVPDPPAAPAPTATGFATTITPAALASHLEAEIERTYGPLACKALPALLEWLALRSDLDSLAGESSAITMMTVHSAKGLEFPAVFVAGMEESIFPHVGGLAGNDDAAKLEEERRLAYVAITRARKRLFLTYAATRRTYGSTTANPRSRFLNEIPAEDIEYCGVGSSGFSGVGWEKRGDRRGTFGSGTGSEYGGNVFGSYTRSAGGAQRHRSISPDAGLRPAGAAGAGGRTAEQLRPATFGSGQPRGRRAGVSPTVEQRRPDAARAAETFSPGDKVSHKTFGTGSVVSVAGDMIEVQFDKSGQVKKLMKGFAPIVKLG